jgi:type IV pilus assembly protein PilQ
MAGLVGTAFGGADSDPLISLSVQQTEMRDVLKFIAEQSGTSVVMAPAVSTTQLTLDLQDVPLSECLDVILKPYGYGYRRVGKTIVVDQLEGLSRLSTVEPLQTKVFRLNYLTANDILPAIKDVLSPRGKANQVEVAQMAGWNFAEDGGTEEGTEVAKRSRQVVDPKKTVKSSKTIIVQDVPATISAVQTMLDEVDVPPRQIEIRAYFVELSGDAIKDIGVDWQFARNSGEWRTGRINSNGTIGNSASGDYMSDPALSGTDFSKLATQGMQVGLLRDGSWDFGLWLKAVQGNDDVNVLSAPRVLALENQEASILVGKREPIVSSEEKISGGVITTKYTLEYYERIGIQLNVVPQLCSGGVISMVVHPVVTEQIDERLYYNSSDNLAASYPVIQTREAETRMEVENGQTVALGGLINDRRSVGVNKVPLLGDIPFLGRLFRRDTTRNEKVELVIFLSASVQDASGADGEALNRAHQTAESKLVSSWTSRFNEDAQATVAAEADAQMAVGSEADEQVEAGSQLSADLATDAESAPSEEDAAVDVSVDSAE